jgi:MFS family permease
LVAVSLISTVHLNGKQCDTIGCRRRRRHFDFQPFVHSTQTPQFPAPIVVFSLISGVVADALDRRRLMLATNLAAAVVAVALALPSLRGPTAVWPIYALAAISASVGAFDLPARQALVPSLVPRERTSSTPCRLSSAAG